MPKKPLPIEIMGHQIFVQVSNWISPAEQEKIVETTRQILIHALDADQFALKPTNYQISGRTTQTTIEGKLVRPYDYLNPKKKGA